MWGVNAQTERLVWPMPNLEVVLYNVRGSKTFVAFDFFKGYWQFALDKSCQELFSFATDFGLFSPTRVLMGGSDSVIRVYLRLSVVLRRFIS